MELDAMTVAALLGTGAGSAFAAVLAQMGITRARTTKQLQAPDDVPAQKSTVTKAEAAAMVAEAERLARIEHNTTSILRQQDEHAKLDADRFARNEERLDDVEWRLHRHGSAIMAQGATLDTTRDSLGLATSPGGEPGERWEKMVNEPRRGRKPRPR